ncbi:unnamed protein product [Mycena citricolor]|uniref:F-box domain-containing protein n=1 Tax=Mycena citricolor TaxID=2018698 RepID=A0AAD2K800_9AGAR|nr:unnamed protein product [Mycena citricolor]
MADDPANFAKMLEAELRTRVSDLIRDNPSMTPKEAMVKASQERLTNNPFQPPLHGCPINTLPPELLAHIFEIGRAMEEQDEDDDGYDEGDDYGDDEVDDEWTDDEDIEVIDEEVVEDEDVVMSSPKKPFSPLEAVDPPQSDSGSEEDEEEELHPSFQVLVSHVCRHWREVSLAAHTLWTTLKFNTHLNLDRAKTYIERANGLPLDIFIDCTHEHQPDLDDLEELPDSEMPSHTVPPNAHAVILSMNPVTGSVSALEPLSTPKESDICIPLPDLITIIELLTPHVEQWRIFEVTVKYFTHMHEVLKRIALLPSAPLLVEMGLYNYEDFDEEDADDEFETFKPAELREPLLPFGGNAPKLKNVAFWAVHIDWDQALEKGLLTGLHEIELAYHAKDVRPSFETFKSMIDSSPQLSLLSMCLSGTTGEMTTVELPSLRSLVLCVLEAEYVALLVQAFVMPQLHDLTLDLHDEDFTDFALQLAEARSETEGRRSLLSGLTALKLTSFPCNDAAADKMMSQLDSLERFQLNCVDPPERVFALGLIKIKDNAPLYCPKLQALRIEGIGPNQLKKLISARKSVGAPIRKLYLSTHDELEVAREQWVRDNVEEFDYFDPSDDEVALVDDDMMIEDDEGSDGSDDWDGSDEE